MNTPDDADRICCPKFDPAPWDDKVIEWQNKAFIKDHVCTVFYMPLNFGAVMRRFDKKVRMAGARVPDNLCLSEHISPWRMNLYLAIDKDVPETERITLSGRFFSKVYEGPFSRTGQWCKEFDSLARTKGMQIAKLFIWYTTCPRCARKYGKNYVVIVGQVAT
jgi:hypothetical protein